MAKAGAAVDHEAARAAAAKAAARADRGKAARTTAPANSRRSLAHLHGAANPQFKGTWHENKVHDCGTHGFGVFCRTAHGADNAAGPRASPRNNDRS